MSYEKRCEALKKETHARRQAIMEKYAETPRPYGLDGSPGEVELGEVTKWFQNELNQLRKEYGLS